jgi:hypothetical protein
MAKKTNKYICPHCEKDVIFRNGKIKKPHFAHRKSNSPCFYYDKPSESQIHKDAKLLMKTIFDHKNAIKIHRICSYCDIPKCVLNITVSDYIDKESNQDKNFITVLEHRFYHENSERIADVAVLHNNHMEYIFEICYRHKTKEENRPEPWFEIDAEKLIHNINHFPTTLLNKNVAIECIRNYKCDRCEQAELLEIEHERMKREYQRMKRERERMEHERKLQYLRDKQGREEREELAKRQRYLELQKIQHEMECQKQIERQNEKKEILNMSNEDERTIQIEKKKQLALEKIRLESERIRIERENVRKRMEEERELQSMKQKKSEYERIKQLVENDKLNMKCSFCKVNYCKCISPQYVKNKYNLIICSYCSKKKCMCSKITTFFK